MNFKKITLIGFKSFADKTVIDFNDEITAIVGPNGCGKSNISDAVQWVLGEQSSKQLRGKNMQDVIFSGTEKRKNMGYTEVSLFFDNKLKLFDIEYDDVVVTRKLYRSGESEYFINKTPCRLKDIKNMLYNSGLGKDGYSIIGQGRVSEILNSRPEERRAIFEDAAGISHFKAARSEAERKLTRTIENLNRNHDIINEIERTLFPLKKQSENAKKYIELKEKLKVCELNNYIYQYDNSNNLKDNLKQKIKEIDEEIANKKYDLENSKKQSELSFTQLNDIDSETEKINQEVLRLTVSLEKFSGSTEILKEKSHHLEYLSERKDKIISKINVLENKNKDNNIIYNDKKSDLLELSSTKDAAKTKYNDSAALLIKKESEINIHNEEIIKINSQINKLETRVKILEDMKKNNESYKYSVRNLLINKDSNINLKNKIIGVIADLIQVPDGYEIAIEMALGNSIQNIVTQNEEDAKYLINYLKTKKLGRATFLPLTTVRPRKINEENKKFLETVKYKGIASEIVECGNNVRPIIEYLLGAVVIAQDIDDAIYISKNIKHSLKVVTLDGEVFAAGGSITGGLSNMNSNSTSIIGREAQIDRLKKEHYKFSEKLNKLSSKKEHEQKRLMDLEAQTESYAKEYSELKIYYAKEEERFEKIKYVRDNALAESKSLEEEKKALFTLIDDAKKSINKKEGQPDDSINNKSIKQVKDDLDKNTVKLEKIKDHKNNLQKKIQELEEDKSMIQDEITKINNKKYKEEINLSRIDSDLETMQENIWEEYELTYSSCLEYKVESYNLREGLINYSKTKKQIEKLGYINVGAIEEFKMVNERYIELKDQVDDLDKAKNDLIIIIKNLSKKMVKKFNEEFNKININFNEIFKELFGGGSANLELIESEDNEDELSRGVEIYANPPGKKLKNILQLSGGERSLTAIAILFSILKLRPMPFCLLDEIEAALDDANISRFASYLKNFSKQTQFIVITHRKHTMQLADSIYGVTMPEKGVSKIVSVSLEDAISNVNLKQKK